MASFLTISNVDGSLRAELAPANGGMAAQIVFHGKELLHLDRGALDLTPMGAGGMPILFPFPSRTKDDAYTLNGKAYRMPMHGLLKNEAFSVVHTAGDEASFRIESSPSWQEGYYPFDFRFTVTYRVSGDCLTATASIENRSGKSMPHYLGWHPFFRSTDKKRITLEHDMRVHYDYVRCVDDAVPDMSDLSLRWDDVLHTTDSSSFTLRNEADGYAVQCNADSAFSALVVCSWVEESMCVEPWCGLPDSINQGRFIEWIAPGECKDYQIRLRFSEL